MRVLITGITGNVGAPLLRRLARAEGLSRVFALYREEARLEPLRARLAAERLPIPIEYVHWDLREPMDSLPLAVDAVVHAAALRGPAACNGDAREAYLVNSLGTKHLVDFALRSGVKAFLHFSIQSVYDRACPPPIPEEAPVRGDERYQITKLAAEMEVTAFLGARVNHQILRLAHVYGFEYGHGLDGILKAFLREVPEGRIRIDGSGDQSLCFLHIDDLCDLTLRLLRNAPPSGIYNVCSETLSVRELGRLISEATQKSFGKALDLWQPEPEKVVPGGYGLDITKIQTATGWAPERRLRDFVEARVASLAKAQAP
jgi:nucleoside-diphosphate-sugar epimerase